MDPTYGWMNVASLQVDKLILKRWQLVHIMDGYNLKLD